MDAKQRYEAAMAKASALANELGIAEKELRMARMAYAEEMCPFKRGEKVTGFSYRNTTVGVVEGADIIPCTPDDVCPIVRPIRDNGKKGQFLVPWVHLGKVTKYWE